ncbi:MAG: hypothetical protein EA400_03395 [Chromatiaceae bacterium]|nr:MAG: hypothetical protein EA400_03395 [Chromatiaceae bacterium]
MTDEQRQRLSLLMDGECGPLETRRAIDEASNDAHLRACWERYQLIGQVLRGESVILPARGIAAGVAAAVAREPTPLRPPRRRQPPAAGASAPIIGVALAAGLVLLAVVVGPRLDGPLARPNLPGNVLTETAVAATWQTFGGLVQSGVQGGRAVPVTDHWQVGEPAVASRLNELLVNHRERAAVTSFTGPIPFVTVVGHAGAR